MTATRLTCYSALIALTSACAGHHGSTSPHASVERALTDRFGYPNVLRVSPSAVLVEYGVYEETYPHGGAPADPYRPLAVRIARTAVAGYGESGPAEVHVVLQERRDVFYRAYSNYGVVNHDYVFRAASLKGR
jgi:hypothetical protein